MTLRDYQHEAADCIIEEWKAVDSTLLVLATGLGKTIVFSDIIQRMQPKRAMVIAHREELIWQARDKIERVTGLECGIEMAELTARGDLFGSHPVIISTVQTQNSSWNDHKRMCKFKPEDFGLLVIDECFPAGTLVDGRPIESFKYGDTVRTHNGFGTVTRTFRKPVQSLCVITFQDRSTLVCTPNHPVWTQNGFKCAEHLTNEDVVVSITDYEQLRNLQHRNKDWKKAVWEPRMQVLFEQGHHPELVQETRRGDHQVQKNERHARPCREGEGVNQVEGNGLEASVEKGKWVWTYDPRACPGFGAWVAMQCDREHADGQTQWLSELLQTGCRQFRFEGWGRGGRILTLLPGEAIEGHQEGGVLEFVGVDSVKVYESSDRDAIEWLCPEGFVYNLEVSNGHTYFAAGVLVHNCHHGISPSYQNLINYYRQNKNLKVLGVTATPDRTDEEALGQIFQTVAYDYEILDGITDGWLVPIEQQFVSIAGLDFSSVRTTAGDLNGADLNAVMEAESNMQGVAGASIEIIGNRRTIIFTASVKQAEVVCNILNRHRAGMAEWVCGLTNKDVRRETLARFESGATQVVCNCGVLTEGFDNPAVEVIVMARPTKSRSLYAQMAGRSTRPLPGIVDGPETADERRVAIAQSDKKSCWIIDFVGNSGRHKLMSCIAEGQLVLTDCGLVPIEHVKDSMRVWDGLDFVPNTGVVFKGEQKVITYAGLTATEDHEVWTEEDWLPFGHCASEQIAIAATGDGGQKVREADGYFRGGIPNGERQVEEQAISHDSMRVWSYVAEGLSRACQWYHGLQDVCVGRLRPSLAGEKMRWCEASLRECESPILSKLWGAWNKIQIQDSKRHGPMGDAQSWIASRLDVGSNRQRRALRSWKSAMGDLLNSDQQQSAYCMQSGDARVSHCLSTLQNVGRALEEIIEAWPVLGSDSSTPSWGWPIQRTARVFDVTNAGPRNRFTVQGLLVSNCADILGGKVSDAAIERAILKAKKSAVRVDMTKELEEAEAELQREAQERRQQEEARKARLVAKVKYQTRTINPFDAFELHPVKARGWDQGKTLSEKQKSLLLKQGVNPDEMPYVQGRQLIREMFRRWNHHLCTVKQASLLRRFGYETHDLTMKDASALIDRLAKNNWRKL
jgi:superfamily II DNA or RNA helicase